MKNKIKRVIGDIFVIPLNEGFAYGRIIQEPLVAIYDLKSDQILDANNVLKEKVFLKMAVMNYAITSGIWKIIGHKPLEEELKRIVKFFKIDSISEELTIYWEDKGSFYEIPATYEKCKDLEMAAVWEPEHVVERLEDYFNGKTNKYLQANKDKLEKMKQ